MCVLIPVFLSGVDSQTGYLRSLQRSIRVRVLVTLIVAEGAIIQRAPAATELYMEGQKRFTKHNIKKHNKTNGLLLVANSKANFKNYMTLFRKWLYKYTVCYFCVMECI